MITLDIWETIRIRCVANKEPIKRVARELGISKNTVRKYLVSGVLPLPTKNAKRHPRMSAFESHVDQLLRQTPKITAGRIAQIIKETIDPSFSINERSVREYVAKRRMHITPKEAYVRLIYTPGDQVQLDFKDVLAIIDGKEVELHMFVARLSYSTMCFARCYFTEDRPALFDGIVSSCVRFYGIPREGIFDNATTAVKRVLLGRNRELNTEFAALCGSLALKMNFAAPAKGNEKGGVEGIHGYIEDNFFRPMPAYQSLEELNQALGVFTDRFLERRVDGEPVAERFERERSAFLPMPSVLPETCVRESTRINKFVIVHR